VLWSRRETPAVAEARLQLEARVSGVDVSADDVEQRPPPPTEDDTTSAVDVGTLKARSPFTRHFESFVEDITSATTDTADDITDNPTFCRPAFAQVIFMSVTVHSVSNARFVLLFFSF